MKYTERRKQGREENQRLWKIKQKLNYFFHPSSLDRVHCLSLRKMNYGSELCCQKYQIPELENSVSQPFSPDYLKILTPHSLCTPPPSSLRLYILNHWSLKTVFATSVSVFISCVFLCLFVKVKSGGDNGGTKKESGWGICVLGDWELRLQNNLKPLKIKLGRDLKSYLVFPSLISKKVDLREMKWLIQG